MVHLIVYGGGKVHGRGPFAKKCEAKLGYHLVLFRLFWVISYLPMFHNDLSRLFYELPMEPYAREKHLRKH
jgi:hypothetical protein